MAITIISPGHRGLAAEKRRNLAIRSRVDTDVILDAGTYQAPDEDWVEEPLECGIRLILVRCGRLRCRIPGQPEQEIAGSTLCAIANSGAYTSSQAYGTDEPLSYVSIQLGAEALDRDGGCFAEHLRPRSGTDPRMLCRPAPRCMNAIAAQIMTCPMAGRARDLYLAGKALEFAARGAELLAGGGVEAARISCGEIDRIHAAREILIATMDAPPTLEGLAARVGMNPRKLTAGFRRVFGTSVFGYLHDHRLREAHRMLSDEEVQVATVAYRVGYSPAHFAIAFRKRFGISPSEIGSRP